MKLAQRLDILIEREDYFNTTECKKVELPKSFPVKILPEEFK